jgi:glycosyltransferase involved in cell wall biosynthesis
MTSAQYSSSLTETDESRAVHSEQAATASCFVLSGSPLPPALRNAFDADSTEFGDLATLRRGGFAELVRHLRSRRTDRAVVAGDESDLVPLKNQLVVLAYLIPAHSRFLRTSDGSLAEIKLSTVVWAVLQIAFAEVLGLWALAINTINASRLLKNSGSAAAPRSFEKCLYLKPVMTFGAPVGGAVAHTAGVVNALARGGQKVVALQLGRQAVISPKVEQVDVPLGFISAYPYELNFHIRHRRFVRTAAKYLRNLKPNYIYQRYCSNDLTGPLLRRRTHIPLVMEFNGSEVWIQKNWGRAFRFERSAEMIERANLRAADLVVVVSDEIKKQVEANGVSSDRILVHPNCVDPTVFDPKNFTAEQKSAMRRRLEVPQDALLFTFVGTFGRWHGTDALAKAIKLAVDQNEVALRNTRAHFLYIGDGPLASVTREILRESKYRNFVTFAGPILANDIPLALAASDVLMSPHVPNDDGSPFFGSPTKLFEYMAMAKPIIASDLEQIGQILRGWMPGTDYLPRDGSITAAAMLVRPGDPAELAGAIFDVAAMPEDRRNELGLAARNLATKLYTWDSYAERLITTLQQRLS